MSFEAPLALIALIVVPIAVAAYLAVQGRRDRDGSAFASPALIPNLVDVAPGWRRHAPPVLLLLAVVAFLIGMARPHATVAKRSNDAVAIVAIDASRSMGATDVRPTRLGAAQAIARRFVAGLPAEYRVAVVGFGSRAQVVAAPTRDRAVAVAAINGLRVGEATALGDALATAVRVAQAADRAAGGNSGGGSPPATILVLSDGALDGGEVRLEQAIERAQSARVPVFTGVVGTPDGIVEVPLAGGFVQRIQVPPDAPALRAVADGSRGRFFATPAQQSMAPVYANLRARQVTEQKRTEVTYAFAGGGAVLLLVSWALSALWFRRVT